MGKLVRKYPESPRRIHIGNGSIVSMIELEGEIVIKDICSTKWDR